MPKGYAITDLSNGKLCPRCETVKPVTDFYKDKGTKTGLQVYCKPCQHVRHLAWLHSKEENKADNRRRAKAWRDTDPERAYDGFLLRNYKLKPGGYAELLTAQNGVCAICSSPKPGGKGGRFHVDHCHSTQKIRGLLCNSCNNGLGRFKDDVNTLHRVIEYLSK